jgi:hypothetical protein
MLTEVRIFLSSSTSAMVAMLYAPSGKAVV